MLKLKVASCCHQLLTLTTRVTTLLAALPQEAVPPSAVEPASMSIHSALKSLVSSLSGSAVLLARQTAAEAVTTRVADAFLNISGRSTACA